MRTAIFGTSSARIPSAGTPAASGRAFHEPGFVFGEPIFVARPEGGGEDDSVIVSVGSHVDQARAAMVVLDARSLDVRAWAEVPFPIPLGFHGSFFRD